MTPNDRALLRRNYSTARARQTQEINAQWDALEAELAQPAPNTETLADLEFALLGDCEIIAEVCDEP